jgi:predicted branched-subunit amino acid permease
MDDSRQRGLRGSAQLALPTALVGATFGLVAVPLIGLPATLTMSAVVWSGAAQFAALSVVAAGGGLAMAASAALLANARFLPMGFAVAPSMTWSAVRRVLGGAVLADASFALAHRGAERFDPVTLVWAAPLQYLSWVLGTAAGAVGSGLVPDPERWGLDVVFPVFYLALLRSELLPTRERPGTGHAAEHEPSRRPVVAAAVAGAVAVALLPFTPPGIPVVVAASAALLGLLPEARGGSPVP